MKIAFLPHYFRKISYWFMAIGCIPGFFTGFYIGFNSADCGNPAHTHINTSIDPKILLLDNIFTWMLYLGMFFYMLSKEKIEDEFVQVKRAEALSAAFLFTLLLHLILGYVFHIENIRTDVMLFLQMLLYIIFFKFNKAGLQEDIL